MTTNSFDLFTDSLPGGGSATVECQCGHLHLCPDNSNYDFDGEPEGSWTKHCEADLKFIKEARSQLFLGLRVFYNSSW